MELSNQEQKEIKYWEHSEIESPNSDSIEAILLKTSEARVFLEKLSAYSELFKKAESILELGGGQCWASCIVKRLFPAATVTATDISHAAVASLHKWEDIYKVKVDKSLACRSVDTPFPANSFDLIFVYSAAHHFRRHRRTFLELARILKPNGAALYLHEPGCREFMYGPAYRRVNARRPEVPEDVLRYQELVKLGEHAGVNVQIRFAPTTTNREPLQMIYYLAQQKIPFLKYILPTSIDFVIHKDNSRALPSTL